MSRKSVSSLLFFLSLLGSTYFLIVEAVRGAAQQSLSIIEPTGGGEAPLLPTDEITKAQRKQIHSEIRENILLLESQGMLAPASPEFVALLWPVRRAPGVTDFAIDAISNYVDHNPSFPSMVLDWNCGTRTYDQASGYNHKGIDIFTWPFTWQKMDNDQVEIVAAAAGTIVAKHDGNFDRSCGFNSNFWNAVYVRHSDNSVAWYGHMKNGSLTPKSIGETVAAGEKLGVVGSSGNSTGPHLHFELYDSAGQLQDPFEGPCNSMNAFTWWSEQEPYRAPRINRLMTQSGPPIFNTCPNQEIPNEKTLFRPGNSLIAAAYYRDQTAGQQTIYSLVRPDGSHFSSWSHNSPNTYSASYWYWSWTIPPNPPNGIWKFRAVFSSTVYEQEFTVDSNAVVSGQVLDAAGRGLRNAVVSIVSSQNVTRSVPTSSLGFYSFEGIQVGGTYTLRVTSRRFRFESRQVSVNDDLANIDFTGME